MAELYCIHLRVSRVENGQYLAESDLLPGLVAQGCTVPETIEIAQDVARRLLESYRAHGDPLPPGLAVLDAQSLEVDIAVGV